MSEMGGPQAGAEILDSIRPGASSVLVTLNDAATIKRIAGNLADYNAGQLAGVEAEGVFSVNVAELLEIIGRLSLLAVRRDA